MKLQVVKTDFTTSIYDDKMEICKFVTGSSMINMKYAKIFIESKEESLIEFANYINKQKRQGLDFDYAPIEVNKFLNSKSL